MDGHFAIGVGYVRTANRETYEFFLTINGLRASGQAPVFRRLDRGSDLQAEAVSALRTILRRREPK